MNLEAVLKFGTLKRCKYQEHCLWIDFVGNSDGVKIGIVARISTFPFFMIGCCLALYLVLFSARHHHPWMSTEI